MVPTNEEQLRQLVSAEKPWRLSTMAITLQTVLPQKVLPRAPSPNANSPNPGIRSGITKFIPASPDASLDQDGFSTPTDEPGSNDSAFPNSNGTVDFGHAAGSSSQTAKDTSHKSPATAPMIRRKSLSAGVGSRRGIAHSSRILGVDKDTRESFALSQLTNGKVDVSFEGTLAGRTPSSISESKRKGKGKAREAQGDGDTDQNGHAALFDVDLEAAQQTAPSSSTSTRTGHLLQLGSHSMPWSRSKSNLVPAYQEEAGTSTTFTPLADSRTDSLDFARLPKGADDTKADYSAEKGGDDEDYRTGFGAFDDDREQLLYAGADDEEGRPGYFAPGDRSFAYNSLHAGSGPGGYGGAVGFEALTWREGGWMVLSGLLVAVLMMVAILISIDVIDWPGDGIGKN